MDNLIFEELKKNNSKRVNNSKENKIREIKQNKTV